MEDLDAVYPGLLVYWHARVMVLAWAICAPMGVLLARYYKVTPKQDWPKQLDNKFWWYSHLLLQNATLFATLAALLLIALSQGSLFNFDSFHQLLGWLLVVGVITQVLSGIFRGSKGGPGDPGASGSWYGDHYTMSRYRRCFEVLHKSLGYTLILLSVATIISGLIALSAPLWMFGVLTLWWLVLVAVAIILECAGRRVDTYMAIWGHPPAERDQVRSDPGYSERTNPKSGAD